MPLTRAVRATRPQPRGEPRERAILLATLELLAEVGYERVTMDAVAARAHASKATIYRRWPGKAELAVAAVRSRADDTPLELPETGDLRTGLLDLLHQISKRFSDKDRSLMIGLLGAAEHDPELGTMIRAEIAMQKAIVTELIARSGAARGISPAQAGLMSDVAQSAIAVRLLISRLPVDDDYLVALVDGVLLPLLPRGRE